MLRFIQISKSEIANNWSEYVGSFDFFSDLVIYGRDEYNVFFDYLMHCTDEKFDDCVNKYCEKHPEDVEFNDLFSDTNYVKIRMDQKDFNYKNEIISSLVRVMESQEQSDLKDLMFQCVDELKDDMQDRFVKIVNDYNLDMYLSQNEI